MLSISVPSIDAGAILHDLMGEVEAARGALPRDTCLTIAEALREEVRFALMGWLPSPDAILAWPALAHLPQTAAAITSSIRVEPGDEDGSYAVILDADRMGRLGVPPEIIEALEYGTSTVPARGPLSRVGAAIDGLARAVAESVAQRIERRAHA